jgi:carbon-monoxide dehydrogenase medium subunit
VKPPPFDYDSPDTLEGALELLAEHGDDAKVLAGGQSLIPLMALRLARPGRLVDIGRIDTLRHISTNGGLTIGSGVRQRAVERSPEAVTNCPLLGQTIPLIAHTAIRTRGTVGGSVAHGDPAAELPAVMLLTDADMVIRSRAAERIVGAADFYLGFLQTVIEPDELLVEIRMPAWSEATGSAFEEVARRHGDFALVGCGAMITVASDGTMSKACLAFTGVASTPLRALEAERLLLGQVPSGPLFSEAAAQAQNALELSDDLHATAAYRRHVAGLLARRVLSRATDGARGEGS